MLVCERDATNSLYPVTMPTIRHTRIWQGAYNQAVAPGITRPLHATGPYQGEFSLWCRKGNAFYERPFALHRQQPEKDK